MLAREVRVAGEQGEAGVQCVTERFAQTGLVRFEFPVDAEKVIFRSSQ